MSKFLVDWSKKIVSITFALSLLVGAGLLLHAKFAYAASSWTYAPNANDVAIGGPNSILNSPTSHFLIRGTGGNVDVTIEADSACTPTAGVPGLQATIDGVTKTHPGDICGGAPIVFNNVSPGELTVTKINGQGHQAFTVTARGNTGVTDVMVTQMGDPDRSKPNSFDDNYAVNVWGSGTFEMDAPCNIDDDQTYYIKWKDADFNNDFQQSKVKISYTETNTDIGPGGHPPAEVWNSNQVQQFNSVGSYPIKHVYHGDHIKVTWSGVSGSNSIEHILPFTQRYLGATSCGNPPTQQCNVCNCPGKPACPGPGTASCNTLAATTTAVPGQKVTVGAFFNNDSNSTDWLDGYADIPPPSRPRDQHSGVMTSIDGPGTLMTGVPNSYTLNETQFDGSGYYEDLSDNVWHKDTSGVYKNIATGATTRTQPANSHPVLRHGQTALRGWDVTATAPGITTFYFSIRNDTAAFYGEPGGGWFAGVTKMCSFTITWSYPGSIDAFACTSTIVTPSSVDYTLRFFDLDANTSQDVGELANVPINVDTFTKFGFMLPHHVYQLYMIAGGQTVDSRLINDDGSLCMSANCQGSINANGEPGERINPTYGVHIVNKTSKTFAGYSGAATLSGGLVWDPPGSPTTVSKDFPETAGINYSNLDGPWSIRADYGGSISVSLQYNGGSIDYAFGLVGANACSRPYTPQTRATMKVTNGDISSGGGFDVTTTTTTPAGTVVSSVCPGTDTAIAANKFSDGNPRYVSPSTTGGTPNSGGIRTFGYPSSKQGSGADFAAYALGYIDGISGGPSGFYSANSSTGGAGYRSLMFANTAGSDSGPLGGLLGGQLTTNHCVTDYFNTTRKGVLPAQTNGQVGLDSYNISQQLLLQKPNGQNCLRVRGNLGIDGSGNGVRLTIYTDDDICINGDITYSGWKFDTTNYTNNAPYLTIISRGNIYIENNVQTITGLFIAQPDDSDNGGIFSTCAMPNTAAIPASTVIASSCRTPLTIKGSVIAQRIYPIRAVGGTLWNNTGNSETFDYIPSMIVGTPNLSTTCGGAVTGHCIDAETNLPPVF
jgi:hypothetical protein